MASPNDSQRNTTIINPLIDGTANGVSRLVTQVGLPVFMSIVLMAFVLYTGWQSQTTQVAMLAQVQELQRDGNRQAAESNRLMSEAAATQREIVRQLERLADRMDRIERSLGAARP